jgi:excisionase family DNA binding protein
MQAYATAERLTLGEHVYRSRPKSDTGSPCSAPDTALVDQLLGRLADLVVDRLMARTEASVNSSEGDWMDTRAAASYLGIHRDTLRKLAAARIVPVHQDGPGCKLYFRRDQLDEWRRSCRSPQSHLRAVS